MKRFTKMLDSCTVILRKPTALTYQITIKCNIGGIKRFEILGCGNSLEQAADDAIFIYENHENRIFMLNKEWQFNMKNFNKKIWIETLANRLRVEGLTNENYTQSKAIEILQECVSGYSCVKYLKEFESEIINLL